MEKKLSESAGQWLLMAACPTLSLSLNVLWAAVLNKIQAMVKCTASVEREKRKKKNRALIALAMQLLQD